MTLRPAGAELKRTTNKKEGVRFETSRSSLFFNVEAMSGIRGKRINHPASPNRPKNRRRISALSLLERQLISGVKPVKKEIGKTIPLEASDVKRIEREIQRLRARVILA